MRYPSIADAKRRLSGGIVQYRGKHYNSNVEEGLLRLRRGDEPVTLNYNDEEVDISSVHIGWTIWQGGAAYYARKPIDSQNQATRIDLCSVHYLDYPSISTERIPLFLDNPTSKGVYEYINKDMLGKKYGGFTLIHDKTEVIGVLKDGVVHLTSSAYNKKRAKVLGDHYGLPVEF